MDPFGCDAPQFLDFANLDVHEEDKERMEAYFDHNHEKVPTDNEYQKQDNEEFSENEDDGEETDEQTFYTPMHNKEFEHQGRLSVSMVCLSEMNKYLAESEESQEENDLSETLQNTQITVTQEVVKVSSAPTTQQPNKIITPRMNNTARLRTRSNSELNTTARLKGQRFFELAKPKSKNNKYISMVEAMNKFEKGTPARYHSKPKGSCPSIDRITGPIASTVPHSPALATKVRQRPVTVLSAKDLELIQYEEQKKFKIKANPVNRKVLAPIKPIPLSKKPPTQPQPFKITEMPKKVAPPKEKENRQFNAQPMPKSVPKPIKLKEKCLTKPLTPNVLKHHPPKVNVEPKKIEEKPKEWKPVRTTLKPFTFEERDKNVNFKKERKLQQQLEEEKKQREFHARPLPKKIYENNSHVPIKLPKWIGSIESIKSMKSDDDKPFKPRPPVSLLVEPFIPKKSERPPVEPVPFELNSERRARERREYDDHLKEKERLLQTEKQLKDEEKRLEEERRWKEQRKLCEHKSQPIRKYKDVPVIPTKVPTMPQTPKFVKRICNKENLAEPLSTSN